MILDKLHQKPAGETDVRLAFSIDIDGINRIEKKSLETGKKVVISKKAIWLID